MYDKPTSNAYDLGFNRTSLATYKPDNDGNCPGVPDEQRDLALEKQEDYEVTYEKVSATSSYTDICSMGVLDTLLYPGSITIA